MSYKGYQVTRVTADNKLCEASYNVSLGCWSIGYRFSLNEEFNYLDTGVHCKSYKVAYAALGKLEKELDRMARAFKEFELAQGAFTKIKTEVINDLRYIPTDEEAPATEYQKEY